MTEPDKEKVPVSANQPGPIRQDVEATTQATSTAVSAEMEPGDKLLNKENNGTALLNSFPKLSKLQKFILVDSLRERPDGWKSERWDFDARHVLEKYYRVNPEDVDVAYFFRNRGGTRYLPSWARNPADIRKDLASARAAVSRAKKSLINRGLIEITSGSEQFSRWALTSVGRELAMELAAGGAK
jgi:DNA-binding MarR family transcriptional regulator